MSDAPRQWSGHAPDLVRDNRLMHERVAEQDREVEDLKKRLDFAAAGLGVVERRRDELKAENEQLRATLERMSQYASLDWHQFYIGNQS